MFQQFSFETPHLAYQIKKKREKCDCYENLLADPDYVTWKN